MDYTFVFILLLLTFWAEAQHLTNFTDTFPEIKCGDAYPYVCKNSKYRSIDGSCNNELHPTWGMPYTRYFRLVPANYADGIYAPRVAKSGKDLPLPRILSRTLSPDKKILDKKFSMAAMEYTHIVTHDVLLTDARIESPENQCCSEEGKIIQDPKTRPLCYPVMIPEDDPDFGKSGIRCFNSFLRKYTDIDRGCKARDGYANQMSVVTQFLDLSLVYGSKDKIAKHLREWKGGRLVVDIRKNQEWPPNENTCVKKAKRCYHTGDKRANLGIQLATFQVVLHREHNRIARFLEKLNPHWNDERLYQETRRIFIAVHQYITYYRWLPMILGVKKSLHYRLIYNTTNYVNDYNPTIDPSTFNEIAAAGFRSFHTLLGGDSSMVNENRDDPYGYANINELFNDPTLIEEGDNYNSLLRGMFTQAQEAYDQYYNKQFTAHVNLGPPFVRCDARTLDIQRGRDHGLGTYNQYREVCGYPKAKNWEGFSDFISLENINDLKKLYESPDDVDFTVGATLENQIPGSLTGPTFHCIIAKQFFKSRVGDRFFFENKKSGTPFTLEQLNEIRKASISRMVCDNTGIQSIQRDGFEQVSKTNPLVKCSSLPAIDLSLWAEKQ